MPFEFNQEIINKGVTAVHKLMLQEEYDNIQAKDLPPPTEGVALTLEDLLYKEYHALRSNHYFTMYPMKEDK